uniref:Uncharacterized protein n=1 Tax=viral metagenome TaxID=1070528 RepID=A0A6C0HHA7_9ZZZZ
MEFNMLSMMEKAMMTYTETVLRDTTQYLSSEYGFKSDEALNNMNKTLKTNKNIESKGETRTIPIPSIPFPFTGTIKAEWCEAMKQNYGLYSQCTSPKSKDGILCKTCKIQEVKKGQPTYGYIKSRMQGDRNNYTDAKGKKVANYSMVLKKMGIPQADALAEAATFNIVLPVDVFNVPVKTRGRPKKVVDINNDSVNKKAAARGRPKKEKKVVSANTADDLIASLVAQAQLLKPGATQAQKTQKTQNPDTITEEAEPENENINIDVKKFEFKQKVYLRSEDDILYDIKTQEPVGMWNEEDQCIDEIETDDEE